MSLEKRPYDILEAAIDFSDVLDDGEELSAPIEVDALARANVIPISEELEAGDQVSIMITAADGETKYSEDFLISEDGILNAVLQTGEWTTPTTTVASAASSGVDPETKQRIVVGLLRNDPDLALMVYLLRIRASTDRGHAKEKRETLTIKGD